MTTAVTTLDLRVIERVLGMEDGYVLDFTNASFRSFFNEFAVNIEAARFSDDGPSKAKRLRGNTSPP